jgi:CDP-diacylglycerol pyrophosphatase
MRWSGRAPWTFVVVGAVVATALAANTARADPSALWHIVNGQCVPDQETHGAPAPCAAVSLTGGWAVLKDIVGATQFLLIATARTSGIEDPAILADGAPNYWQAAWDARQFTEARAPALLTRDDIALAINSTVARSQDQFHIHVDCVRADVRDTLRSARTQSGDQWAPISLLGEAYLVRHLTEEQLRADNPFKLVAALLPPGETMDLETMVLVGATLPGGAPGFDLLAGRAGIGGNSGHGEDLQDHDCAIAKATTPPPSR